MQSDDLSVTEIAQRHQTDSATVSRADSLSISMRDHCSASTLCRSRGKSRSSSCSYPDLDIAGREERHLACAPFVILHPNPSYANQGRANPGP